MNFFKASFETFSHHKSLLIKNTKAMGEVIGGVRYPPFDYSNLWKLQTLLKAREVPSLRGLFKGIMALGVGVVSAIALKLKLHP